MRRHFRTVTVNFGAFNFELLCIVGPPQHVVSFVRRVMDDPVFDYDTTRKLGAHFSRAGCAPIIWLRHRPRTPKSYATLAHEVLHVLREMLVDWAGMPLNADTDEAFCHAMGHAVRTISEGLK